MKRSRPDARIVVVGGGTAGCVVASRLSEHPSNSVTLIEAGPDPQPIPPILAQAARQPEIMTGSDWFWTYPVERPDGSVVTFLGGKVTGGGSSVNQMSLVRPVRSDFDAWKSVGGDQWSYEQLLPVMRAIETDLDFGDQPIHGSSGPIRIQRPYRPGQRVSDAASAYIAAARSLGYPECDDLNNGRPIGICSAPYAIFEGIRQSAVVGYLNPARDRPNLLIRADTEVVRLTMSGTAATGVVLRSGSEMETLSADVVILCAGAIQTPCLLLRSGIGPADTLRSTGIIPIVDLPGVGANYRDHAAVHLTYATTGRIPDEDAGLKIRLLASSTYTADSDLEIAIRPLRGTGQALAAVLLLDQRAPGQVTLESTSSGLRLALDPGVLEDDRDVDAIVEGMSIVEHLIATPELHSYYAERCAPPPNSDLRRFARETFSTYHHGVGTCRFGPAGDDMAVATPTLRARQVDNLWIADASVLPTVPHANTNLAATMIGEVAAMNIQKAL